MRKLSCCYYPTTVMLVDDDKTYLDTLELKFKNHFACKTYTDPKSALNFLLNEYQYHPYTKHCVLHPEEDLTDHRSIDIDVTAIRNEAYNPQRFEQIAVLIVDQVMPGLKGLDLCRELGSTPIKKILLTGQVDDKDAISAFNSGVIDKFISKNSPQLSHEITMAIQELTAEYFLNLSEIIIHSLTQDAKHHPFSCLKSHVFIDFFANFIKQHPFAEYYLCDSQGSFMFLNNEGEPSWLVVKDESEMKSTFLLAEVADQKPSPALMKALENKEKILYLHSQEDENIQPIDWEKKGFLHPAKTLQDGNQTYYYAYINNAKAYPIEREKILSYKDFLNKSH